MEEEDPVSIPIDGSLDLHTFVPKDIPSVVSDYIYAAHAAGLRQVRLVHGRGQGIQRGIVQQLLDNPFLLLFLGIAMPTVLYIVWGVMEIVGIPITK